jgi:glucokinase
MRLCLAADVGGTKLAAGVVTAEGAILARREAPTPRLGDAQSLYRAFVGLLDTVLAEAQVPRSRLSGVGVGCGGPMQFPAGIVSPLNIPAWREFPLRGQLAAEFGLPTIVDNDAKAFALGESWRGRGVNATCLLAMVVSTGVGAGIVVNGRLLDGAQGNAGHVGHVIVFPSGPGCACGARGCLEAVASGPSLARAAEAAIQAGKATSLERTATARDIAAAARAGDPLARLLYRRAGVAIGRGIASAAALLDLDRVVIGGGVAQSADLLMPALTAELSGRARLDFSRGLLVAVTASTVESALLGAARLVLDSPGAPSAAR